MKRTIVIAAYLLFCTGSLQAKESHAYLGVWLDTAPLPKILTHHLDLEPSQGLRVSNLHIGSPADKAGLERNDLIVTLNDKPVTDIRAFIDQVAHSEIGSTIDLGIIHRGKHLAKTITLKSRPQKSKPKYDPEPHSSHTIRPGRIYRMDPHSKDWIELDPNTPPPMLPPELSAFRQETYVLSYQEGKDRYTVTIQGDPHDNETNLTVEKGDMASTVSVDAIDELPEEMRTHAKRGLKEARQQARQQSRNRALRHHSQALKDFWQDHAPEDLEELEKSAQKSLDQARQYFDQWKKNHITTPEEQKRIKAMEKELQELRERLDKLESKKQGTI